MKTFYWCSRDRAKYCKLFFSGSEHAHICIRSVGEDALDWKPSCDNPALFLAFRDLDPEAARHLGMYAGAEDQCAKLISECFREEQAVEILEFVKRVTQPLIIVNCVAGISRSAGIVLAFRRHLGGDTEEVYRKAMPNIYVASVMGKVLRERW